MHIAQPALSAQIRALERQLGCELFSRTTRKVQLTASGGRCCSKTRARSWREPTALRLASEPGA
jgi:DNA-binding transcriptional LysR family regulator